MKVTEAQEAQKIMGKKRYAHLDRHFQKAGTKEALAHFISNLGIDAYSKSVIGLASSVHGEGVTTVALYLGRQLVETFNHKVLVVETNMRKPRLAAYARIKPAPGLLQLLTDGAGPATLQASVVENLALLPAGGTSDNPLGLFRSDRFQSFLDAARDRYSIVILDVPPLLPYAEGPSILRRVDDNALVVASESTSEQNVASTVARLEQNGIIPTGTLLNAPR